MPPLAPPQAGGREGCRRCLGTGFHGRTLLAEMVELDGPLRKAILAKADLEGLEAILRERGHSTLRQNGRRLVAKGITTEGELDRVCGAET